MEHVGRADQGGMQSVHVRREGASYRVLLCLFVLFIFVSASLEDSNMMVLWLNKYVLLL